MTTTHRKPDVLYKVALGSCIVGGLFAACNIFNGISKSPSITHYDIPQSSSDVHEEVIREESSVDILSEPITPVTEKSPPPMLLKRHEPIKIQDGKTYTPSTNNGIEFATEKRCRDIIEKYFGRPFQKLSKFCINPLTKAYLELDGYNNDLKIAFEYQGEQHYQDNHSFWGGNKKKFNEQLFRDRVKRVACRIRHIRLIIIPYTAKLKKNGGLEKVLGDYLKKHYPDRQ